MSQKLRFIANETMDPRNYDASASNMDEDEYDLSRAPSRDSAIPTCIVQPTANMYDNDSDSNIQSRKQREFIPENKKDDQYWEKRRKNNDAARRSREKRRMHDTALENRIMEITRDNCKLRTELFAVKKKFGLPLNETFAGDEDPGDHEVAEAPSRDIRDLHDTPTSRSPPKPYMLGYIDGTTAHSTSSPSVPPPLLQMASNMQPGMPLQTAFSPNGPFTRYAGIPSSSEHLTRSGSFSSSTSMPSIRQPNVNEQPPPAHSQRTNREQVDDQQYRTKSEHDIDESTYRLKREYDNDGYPYRSANDIGRLDTSNHISASYFGSQGRNNTVKAQSPPLNHEPKEEIQLHSAYNPGVNHREDYSDDNSQEQPLSLTVRKRVSSFSGNESSTSVSSSDSPLSQSPPLTALPHKLRHKNDTRTSFAQGSTFGNPFVNGLTQLSEIALAHAGSLPLFPSHESSNSRSHRSPHSSRSHIDPRYVERRKRNNEAARKCRENRKNLTSLREVKSNILESENGKLRSELDTLQDEMRELRDMIDRKRVEKESSIKRPSDAENSD